MGQAGLRKSPVHGAMHRLSHIHTVAVMARLLSSLALCCLLSGCIIPPNHREFVKGNVVATSLIENHWPYRFLHVGSEKHPLGSQSPFYFVVENKTVALAGLTPERLLALGAKEGGQFSPGWPKGARAFHLGLPQSSHFLFFGDKLIEAEITALRDDPRVGVGRAGLQKTYYLPLTEGELVELLGPADKIRESSNW